MYTQVLLPMNNPTSCAIGGTNMDTLYITTARHRLTEEERAKVLALKLLLYEALSY
jgi:sugar lactone lactonase YvrE